MPYAAKRPCTHPGCGILTDTGRCTEHKRAPDQRKGRIKKYDLRSWRDGTRPAKLNANPLCEECAAYGRHVPATDVDHVDGNSDNDVWENLRSLCHPCHSAKTATQDGGFKNKKAGGERKNF